MVISCLVNIVQGGGGDVLPRFGILEKSPKTVNVSLILQPIVDFLSGVVLAVEEMCTPCASGREVCVQKF